VNGCPLNPNNLFPLVCKDAFKNNGIADALARRYRESIGIQPPERDGVQSFMAIVDEVKESIPDGAYMHISEKLKQMYDNADDSYDDSYDDSDDNSYDDSYDDSDDDSDGDSE
jgi:hypothetical protein